ncbi:MAG TPA: RHS repeat-associated core domain-containing protein, partial [Candidatus Acidoferrales bacterium]
MESDLSGGNQTEHIYFPVLSGAEGNGQRIAKRNPDGQVYFFFDDHLGNTRLTTHGWGGVLDEFDPYPHGGFRTLSFTSGDWHLFTDHEYDPDTGLHYMRARHYSISAGRFLQPDEFTGGPVDAFSANDPLPPGPLPYAEITNPQSLNKYTYVWNNPLAYVDPNGHELRVADALLATVTKLAG